MHALLLALVVAASAHPHKVRIAVLDVQDVSGDQAAHARLLTQIITGEVAHDHSLEVISSNQIRDLIGFEKQKQLLGCNEGSCLAEIGGALGVNYLLTSQLGKIGSRYRLDLSLVDQAKARTEATVGTFLPAQEDALADTAVQLVGELLRDAGLRKSDSAVIEASLSTSAPVSHTGAYVAYGVAGALAVGAAIMTLVTRGTYQSAVGEFSNPTSSPRPTVASPGDSGSKLKWMGPLTDSLWAGAVIAAGTGTVLFFTARPNGSGGELAVGGRF